MNTLTRRPAGDEGSALVIALLFITSFSLLLGSVITFAEVGLKASKTLSAQADSAYATDGAMNAAINRFRGNRACDNYKAPLGPEGQPLGGRGVIVRCEGGISPAGGRDTRPVNALLSLAPGGPEGIRTIGEQRVLGSIFSNSTVAAEAKLIVQGQVSAVGTCNAPPGNVQTSPTTPLRCVDNPDTNMRADPTQGRDPDYTKAITAVPVRRTVPDCPPGWLVKLPPGYYDNAAALSNFTTTTGSCPGKVVWLQPGNFYLDLDFRGGNGIWKIDDPNVVVVAGTPKGWDPVAAARPILSVPGSCDPVAAQGVQLIAGGGTKFDITKGQVEVCATPNTTDQSIALYGMAGRANDTRTLEPNEVSAIGFDNPGNAITIGEVPLPPAPSPATAVANLTATSRSALVTVKGFKPGAPEGSLIDSATLRVVHKDVGAGAADLDNSSIKVEAAFPGTTCTGAGAKPLTVQTATLTQDTVNLLSCGLLGPSGLNGPSNLANLAVTYSAALAAGGTAATDTLDGIAVDVTYRAPTTGKPTVVTTSAGFTVPDNALEIGEQPAPLTADAALNSPGSTASITVGGLGDPPIPPGSTIDSAVLRVAHGEPRDPARPTLPTEVAPPTVTFSGSTCPPQALPVRDGSLGEDRVDIKACGLNDATKLVGLTATYAVSLTAAGTAGTAKLDGMWLELVYRAPPPTRSPATVTSGPTPTSFSNTENAKVVDAVTSDATLNSGAPTASLTLADFALPAVPVGSIVDSAVLRVAHQDVGAMGTPTLTVAGIGPCSPVLTARTAALGEDPIDLKACGLTDPGQLAGLKVTYTANLTTGATTGATARVDGVVLDLSYRPPVSRRATATATAPATGSFTDPDKAKIIGEVSPSTADVTLNNGAPPASVTVRDYDSSSVPLPAGSIIDSAVLRVAHRDDAWLNPPTLTAAFDGSTPGCAGLAKTLPLSPAAITLDRSDNLTTCGLTKAEQLASLAATFTANAPTTTNGTQVPVAAASTGSTTSTVFANPDNAKIIGESPTPLTADAALTTTTPTASVTVNGYDQPAIPAGSPITSAKLRIAHREDAGVGPVTATVTVPGGTTCSPPPFMPRTSLGEDTIDLAACAFTNQTQLSALSVTFNAALSDPATTPAATATLDGVALDIAYQAPSGTDQLDGIELDVVYRTPVFRPLTGTTLVTVAPVTGDTTTRFAAQGTIYAPNVAVNISMAGLKDQVLTRGVVARTIRLGLAADPGFKRPLLGVPPEPVNFTAYPDVTARATLTSPIVFTNPDKARSIDGDLSSALLSSPGSTSASLELSGFTPDAPLPTGSPIDAAVLRVAHREDIGVGATSVTVNLPGACAAGRNIALPLYASPPDTPGPLGENQIDLKAECELSAAQLATVWTDLIVTYTATHGGGSPATAYLDGITLDLLSGPLLRARVTFETPQDTVRVEGWSVLR